MPDVLSLFSPPGIAGAVIGVFLSWLYWCYKLHRSGAEEKYPRVSLAWVMTAAVVLSIGFSVYEVREQRLRTEQLITCQEDINEALSRWVQINRENNDLSVRADAAGALWIGTLLQPPPDIAALPMDSEARRKFNIDTTITWQKTLATIAEERRVNTAVLARNPIPQPHCEDKR